MSQTVIEVSVSIDQDCVFLKVYFYCKMSTVYSDYIHHGELTHVHNKSDCIFVEDSSTIMVKGQTEPRVEYSTMFNMEFLKK